MEKRIPREIPSKAKCLDRPCKRSYLTMVGSRKKNTKPCANRFSMINRKAVYLVSRAPQPTKPISLPVPKVWNLSQCRKMEKLQDCVTISASRALNRVVCASRVQRTSKWPKKTIQANALQVICDSVAYPIVHRIGMSTIAFLESTTVHTDSPV